MSTPLDEKAVASAHEAYAKTTGGMLDGQPMDNAIRAYLSTTPAPDGLEANLRRYNDWLMSIRIPGHEITALQAGNTMLQAQSALAAVMKEMVQLSAENEAMAKDAQNAWAKHGGTEIALGQWKARAETAEAKVKRLTEANEALRGAIATPEAVHANMLRGGIPKLSIRQALHLHGAEALEKWDGIEAADARIKALEEALEPVQHARDLAWGLELTDRVMGILHNLDKAIATLNSREKVDG